MEKFNDRLRQLREETGLSMIQLAREIGVSNAAICKWENGNAEPKVTYLVLLAERFECTVDYLVCKTDDFGAPQSSAEDAGTKLTHRERQFLETYRRLPKNLKALCEETIKAWNNINNE